MDKDFERDQATKEQWNSARNIGLSLILGIALIAGIAQSVPTWVSVVVGIPIVTFITFHVVRLIKRSDFSRQQKDL